MGSDPRMSWRQGGGAGRDHATTVLLPPFACIARGCWQDGAHTQCSEAIRSVDPAPCYADACYYAPERCPTFTCAPWLQRSASASLAMPPSSSSSSIPVSLRMRSISASAVDGDPAALVRKRDVVKSSPVPSSSPSAWSSSSSYLIERARSRSLPSPATAAATSPSSSVATAGSTGSPSSSPIITSGRSPTQWNVVAIAPRRSPPSPRVAAPGPALTSSAPCSSLSSSSSSSSTSSSSAVRASTTTPGPLRGRTRKYLQEAQRCEIVLRVLAGERQAHLAKEFGITRAAVCYLLRHQRQILTNYVKHRKL